MRLYNKVSETALLTRLWRLPEQRKCGLCFFLSRERVEARHTAGICWRMDVKKKNMKNVNKWELCAKQCYITSFFFSTLELYANFAQILYK